MDFECIEAWLALPEFRVTGQGMRSHDLELHLERRDTYLVCPRCQGSTARRLVSASSGPSGCTIKCVRNTCTGARAMSWRVAMASRHARCFAGRLKRAMADGPASWGGPWALMNTPGVRAIATIRSSWTWTKVDRLPRLQAGEWRTWWHGSQAAHKPNLRESRWWSWICPSHFMRRSTRSLAIRLR